MALQGTIQDFGLADILQLIGLQRKTGTLTLTDDGQRVTIRFLGGNVVGADAGERGVEELLGSVLVRTGKITQEQLEHALRLQRKTLQRLGHVLVKSGAISDEDLSEALRVQSLQIVYRLFRWRNGQYRFDMTEDVDYDERHFVPIGAETILMEGARMVDEWPMIERRIKSPDMVFRKSAAASDLEPSTQSLVEADMELEYSDEAEGGGETEIQISPDEREVLALIDGQATVAQIEDRSSLGEFDTYRILCELLTRNLIETVDRAKAREDRRQQRGRLLRLLAPASSAVVLGFAAAGLAGVGHNPLAPWRSQSKSEATEQLRFYASHARLERIEEAIQVFYLDAGAFPASLALLGANGYLRPADLLDPWGREYGYHLSPGGYRVYGAASDGAPDPELTLSHRFTAAQQMMLGRLEAPPAPAEP